MDGSRAADGRACPQRGRGPSPLGRARRPRPSAGPAAAPSCCVIVMVTRPAPGMPPPGSSGREPRRVGEGHRHRQRQPGRLDLRVERQPGGQVAPAGAEALPHHRAPAGHRRRFVRQRRGRPGRSPLPDRVVALAGQPQPLVGQHLLHRAVTGEADADHLVVDDRSGYVGRQQPVGPAADGDDQLRRLDLRCLRGGQQEGSSSEQSAAPATAGTSSRTGPATTQLLRTGSG